MNRRNLCVCFCFAVFAGLLAAALPAALAQDAASDDGGQAGEGRGRGGRGGRNRGQEGQNGEGGGRNRGGEGGGGWRGGGAGGRGGQRRDERPAGAANPTPTAQTPSNAPPPASTNRGFGAGNSGSRASGFGSNSPASLPPSGAAAAGAAANADAMMKRFDTLKPDGVLDADELARSRFINMKPADRNNDGKVTKDELTAWYVARAQGGGTAAPAAAASASPANSAVAAKPAPGATAAPPAAASNTAPAVSESSPVEPQRKSYRFLTAIERLPGGLPSWFRDKDRDRDGQVLMSEWTSQWSDSAVNEFSRHDRNGDGVITPSEALRSGG